eukprot:TRINITY_DN330_c0_g1_i2.p1 TRINITY_DN330_c0_g1~~TRINITY_DN330_c0_g1_i2.p1  ORF type:complete len:355 (+),score=56.62 TRINITY_DN330_c0_g1_i2:41-1105(+)
MDTSLKHIAILEKDKNGDLFLTWSYPTLGQDSQTLELILKERSNLAKGEANLPFSFSRYKDKWIYIWTEANTNTQVNVMKLVNVFAICLFTETFHPEKYSALCELLAKLYNQTGNPVKLLECYLDVFRTAKYSNGGIVYDDSVFDKKLSLLATSIKEVIRMFEEEIILLWSALLMKKRIVIYCDKLDSLLKVIRAAPLFIWHRQDWNTLRPFMTITEPEIKDIREEGVYVAGFIDPEIKRQEKFYDVFVDVTNRTITVPDHAKDDFNLGAFHQELANYLVSKAEDESVSDQDLIKELTLRTKALIKKLDLLKVKNDSGQAYITLEHLQSSRLPPHMDRFLFAVASAEGMTQTSR